MASRINSTKLTRRFIENSSRIPTNDEIIEFRKRYRNMMKYLKRRLKHSKISIEQYEELKARWDDANVDNFTSIDARTRRFKKD